MKQHFSFLIAIAAVVGPYASVSAAPTPSSAASPASAAPQATGPTPLPANAKDYPGQGVIRVFGWMNENRQKFWAEREKKQGSVVFAGDSLIGGWTTLAKDLPDIPVANRGIGGEPSRGLLFRFQEDVLDLHPKGIVLLSGANDLSALQDIQKTRNNLLAMIDMAEQASPGIPIVLCNMPPRDNAKAPVDPKQLLALNKLIASLAEGRRNVVVLDLYTALAEPDGSPNAEYFRPDKLHLSAGGHERFKQLLVPLLKQFNIG